MSGEVLRLIDGHGQIVESDTCPNCVHHREQREQVERDLENAEVDLRKARAKIRRLEEDRERKHKVSPHRALVESIFELWQDVCGHPNAQLDFGAGSRFEAIETRYRALRDIDLPDGSTLTREEQMRLAVLGAGVDPDCVKGRVYDRVGLLFKSNEKTEDLANRAVRWGNRLMDRRQPKEGGS